MLPSAKKESGVKAHAAFCKMKIAHSCIFDLMAGSCTSWSGNFALNHKRIWSLVILKKTARGQNVSRHVWKYHHNTLECVGTRRQNDTSLSVVDVLPEIWDGRPLNTFQNHHEISQLCLPLIFPPRCVQTVAAVCTAIPDSVTRQATHHYNDTAVRSASYHRN
jgi:hypothetical protein